jgi:hypothetical protein
MPSIPKFSSSSSGDAVRRLANRNVPEQTKTVAIEDGALVPRLDDEGLGNVEARLQRARALLASLRDTSSDAHRRDGPQVLGRSALDLGRSVTNFYRSLHVAKLLSKDGLLGPSVAAFVNDLRLPDDVAPIIHAAVGVDLSTLNSIDAQRTPPSRYEWESEPRPPAKYVDRREAAFEFFQSFTVKTGPISTKHCEHYTSKTGIEYFRNFAGDNNLREIREQLGYDLNSYSKRMTHSFTKQMWTPLDPALCASPADVIHFVARRQELNHLFFDLSEDVTRRTLNEGRLDEQFRTEACVPALLRLAMATRADIDLIQVRMNDGSYGTLRECATRLKAAVKPRATDPSHLSASIRSSEFWRS